MLAFTGLVFTITMLVLQLASSQLSPRVMRTFLRDRQNQVVLGLFVATLLFSLLVLREVRSGDAGSAFVPGLSIWIAFALLVTSVGAFVFYIDHMAHAIRASTVVANIGDEAREAIERLYPPAREGESGITAPGSGERSGPGRMVAARGHGILTNYDADGLLDAAREAGAVVTLLPRVGQFVPEGAPLFRVTSPDGGKPPAQPDDRTLGGLVGYGRERTLQQDLGFGIRQLVDIAVRALSPGTNDPTTAVQAIDQIHDLMRRLAGRPFPPDVHRDDDGVPRLLVNEPTWGDYVDLAFGELMIYGAGHSQVVERLRGVLSDLASVAPAARSEPVRELLREVASSDASPRVTGTRRD
jgi:uncharacterized membrane protein